MNSGAFSYDTTGRHTQNAAGKGFFYDGVNAVQELSGSTVTANLLTGPGVDQAITRTDSSGTSTFLTDAQGSTIALADNAGTLPTQYSYGPFGLTTTSGVGSGNSFQYTGRENDGTGLYYYRARYYNPALGRFISEDPAGMSGSGANLYGYVGNSPTSGSDPSGLWSPPAHDAFIRHALAGCGVPDSEIKALQQASRDFDLATQLESMAYAHSMRAPGQNQDDALRQRNEFIRSRMDMAQSNYDSGDLPDALRNLGRALHPVMDSTSPEHTVDGVPREWCLPIGCEGNRIRKDHSSSDKNGHERTADITSADYDFEDAYIQGAYSFVTGKKLSCRYPR